MYNTFAQTSKICLFNTVEDFVWAFRLGNEDLIITNKFIYEPLLKGLDLSCQIIFQEEYGQGEPSDVMVNAIAAKLRPLKYRRIIGIGGGTVIDVAKVLSLKRFEDVNELYGAGALEKEKELVLVPTTCGTGSEVTNVSVLALIAKNTKMGLANDAMFADAAALIPETLRPLPYTAFMYSAIDALIHASESFLSPFATPHSMLFSRESIRLLLSSFRQMQEKGRDYRLALLGEFMLGANYGGIAFGNAGAGPVHALSLPFGGAFHVGHGESNYALFDAVFQAYMKIKPAGLIQEYLDIVRDALGSERQEDPLKVMNGVLNALIPCKKLSDYGMKQEETAGFAQSVLRDQQRLLARQYTPLSLADIKDIYDSAL